MDDLIAHGAIRRVTIDIANLTGQLALLQSTVEYINQVASGLTPDTWERVMTEDEEGKPEMHVILRGDQLDGVMRVLAALSALG